jgi:hypothetical protein
MKRSAGGVLRREGLTLLITLGVVYLFVSGTLPAILERQELTRQREAAARDLRAAEEQARRLRDWNDGARHDPMLYERLAEQWRLDPESPGYRVIPGEAPPDEGDGSGR